VGNAGCSGLGLGLSGDHLVLGQLSLGSIGYGKWFCGRVVPPVVESVGGACS
jgi:hypothetical protein